ncbi:hypothetical protein EAE91_05670 [Photorhabdus noenieputensis]|uniref:hypothetical protein n=1 Tax=Photorhabdus noenieputensis TaxID=1208607 RepID=UPI001BD28160|nr:hypothetical protein [Photorhabdus noenieputensis]MBS9436684.1 hypothetical protein [Photorhabdus noenieputensis]MCK3669460.1 hypothetical protein [Photorhabdus noenieputensis]
MDTSIIFFITSIIILSVGLNSFTKSLLASSILLALTPLGELNVHIPLILLSILLCLLNKDFTISKNRLLYFILFISLSIIIFFFSFYIDIIKTIGKWAKTIALMFPLTFISNNKIKKEINIQILFKSILLLSIIGTFIWIFNRQYHSGIEGTYRLSGLALDPNYTAILLISFLFLIKLLNYKLTNTVLILTYILILTTQAVSSIVIAIILYIIIYKLPIPYLKKNRSLFRLLVFLILGNLFSTYEISQIFHINLFNDWQNNYLSMKLNSMFIRLNSQIGGIKMLVAEPSRLLYGFGSHVSFKLFGKVMHHAYLQTIFDHGIIFLAMLFFYINTALKKYPVYPLFFYLQIMNFLFDTYFMGIVTFMYIIYISIEKTEYYGSTENKYNLP